MEEIFRENGFPFARMITGSKSLYRENNPNNIVVFNSKVFLEKDFDEKLDFFTGREKQIWYGDLDITKDNEKLLNVAKTLELNLIITDEHISYYKFLVDFKKNKIIKLK